MPVGAIELFLYSLVKYSSISSETNGEFEIIHDQLNEIFPRNIFKFFS